MEEHEGHYFVKHEGVWTCDCGATADRFGHVRPLSQVS